MTAPMTDAKLLALVRRMNDIKAQMVHHEATRYGEDFDVEVLRRLLAVPQPGASDWVPASVHEAAVKKEVDWQYHWVEKLRAAEGELFETKRQLNVGRIERVQRMAQLLRDAPKRRAGAHDTECWKKHPGCMADAMREALTGSGEQE